jgi:hypothetical protein
MDTYKIVIKLIVFTFVSLIVGCQQQEKVTEINPLSSFNKICKMDLDSREDFSYTRMAEVIQGEASSVEKSADQEMLDPGLGNKIFNGIQQNDSRTNYGMGEVTKYYAFKILVSTLENNTQQKIKEASKQINTKCKNKISDMIELQMSVCKFMFSEDICIIHYTPPTKLAPPNDYSSSSLISAETIKKIPILLNFQTNLGKGVK